MSTLLSGPQGKKRPVGCVAYDKRHRSSTPKSPSRLRCVRHSFRRRAPCHRDSLLWVKQRRTHCEQMSSGLSLKADIAQRSRHVSNVIVSMTIPFASILIGAVLLRHAQWKELVSSLGSATGGNRRLVLALKSGWSIRKRWRSSKRKATGLSSSPSPP